MELLRFCPNKSARLLSRCSRAPWAMPKIEGARDIDDLVVSEARVDGGPIMKRIQPRPRHGLSDQAALCPTFT